MYEGADETADNAWSSAIIAEGINGEADGIAILMEGGPSTGRKLRLFPRVFEAKLVGAKIEELDETELSPPSGSVEAEEGIMVSPNSPKNEEFAGTAPAVRIVGSVMADRVTLILGRTGCGGPMSELVWIRGGGSECRLADAEAAIEVFSALSDLRRFMDILRRKPHLPVFVDVLGGKPADREGAGGDISWSLLLLSAGVARRPSLTPRLPKRDAELTVLTEDPTSGLSRGLLPKTLKMGLTIELLFSGLCVKSDPAERILRKPREGGSGRGESSSGGARGCIIDCACSIGAELGWSSAMGPRPDIWCID